MSYDWPQMDRVGMRGIAAERWNAESRVVNAREEYKLRGQEGGGDEARELRRGDKSCACFMRRVSEREDQICVETDANEISFENTFENLHFSSPPNLSFFFCFYVEKIFESFFFNERGSLTCP